MRPIYYFAALIFAHRAFCAAAIRLLAAADIFLRGLTPLLPALVPAFSARILAQRARVAAAILALPAVDICRVGRAAVCAVFALDTPYPVSPNNAKTCCSRSISALTSFMMLSRLKVSLVSRRCAETG